mgnify:CR=1 FL=1
MAKSETPEVIGTAKYQNIRSEENSSFTVMINNRGIIMKKSIILLGVVWALSLALQYPVGFAFGQTVKDREMCEHVQKSTDSFRYTMGGIMRNDPFNNPITYYYRVGEKDGQLWALKGCFDDNPPTNKVIGEQANIN